MTSETHVVLSLGQLLAILIVLSGVIAAVWRLALKIGDAAGVMRQLVQAMGVLTDQMKLHEESDDRRFELVGNRLNEHGEAIARLQGARE